MKKTTITFLIENKLMCSSEHMLYSMYVIYFCDNLALKIWHGKWN